MAGQVSILDDNFVVNDVNGVARWTCVVQGASDHQCQNATAAGVSGFLGVVQGDQDNGLTASIRMLGNTFVKAVGAINRGDPLVIGGTNGYVDALYNVAGAQQIVGYALTTAAANGDLILMAVANNVRQTKKLAGVSNAAANTQTAYPHGLAYIPTKVVLTSRGAGYVYEIAAADATNIYVAASAASIPFDAYVE